MLTEDFHEKLFLQKDGLNINLKITIELVKYFILLFLIFHSCKNTAVEKDSDILGQENLKLRDSIDEILSMRKKIYLTDSVRMDFSKGILGTLYYSDTLVLSGRFADCGEFGGHKEYLKIYSYKERKLCLFIDKSIDCKKSYFEYTDIDSTLYELTNKNQQRIVNYLLELTEVSLYQQDLARNYSNDYEARINSGLSGEPYFLVNPMMSLYFQDQSLMWKEFIEMSDDIKTTARKVVYN